MPPQISSFILNIWYRYWHKAREASFLIWDAGITVSDRLIQMRRFILLFFVLLLAPNLFAQSPAPVFDLINYGVNIQPDRRVMAVLAALEAARTTDENGETVHVLTTPLSEEGGKFREQLQSDIAAMNDKLRERISLFVISHKQRNPNLTDAEIVSQFISMAYSLSPAPELANPAVTSELPAGLLDVLDFAPLVRDFYKQTVFGSHIDEYYKAYQSRADTSLRNSAREMVADLLTFLQTRPQLTVAERVKVEVQKGKGKKNKLQQLEIRERNRRFFIVPEMLAPAGSVNFLNIKDDYYVIIPPDTDLNFSGVRRGFLQFVIDPIVLRHSKEISTIREGVRKLLDERRKNNPAVSPDVFLTISRSIVSAIDARQVEAELVRIATQRAREQIDSLAAVEKKKAVAAQLEAAKLSIADDTAAKLFEDYDKGAVLVFYFAEQLSGVEDSGFDITASMREMLLSFNAGTEATRPAKYEEARKRSIAARAAGNDNPVRYAILENPITTKLIEIQELIKQKDLAAADKELKMLRQTNPGDARLHFNIGRVAAMEAESFLKPEDVEKQKTKLLEAKTSYEQVLRIGQAQRIDAALISLSYVALARIYEFFDDVGYAMTIYDAAIRLGPVAGGGYDEALAGKQRLLKDQ